jgi:hypothetical protein
MRPPTEGVKIKRTPVREPLGAYEYESFPAPAHMRSNWSRAVSLSRKEWDLRYLRPDNSHSMDLVTTMAAGAGQFVSQLPHALIAFPGLGSCSVSSSLRLSHDECRHAKADRSSQTDCQQREPRLDIEPHLAILLKALGVKVGQYLTCGSTEGVRASSTILP